MDMLRSCYKSSMRIYRDRPDVIVSGEWKWCPESAVNLPFGHAFFSRNWDQEPDGGNPDLGELPGPHSWRNGESNPQLTGRNWLGDAFEWEHGGLYSERGTVPVNASGLPFACDLAAATYGGVEWGGSATITVVHTLSGAGGVEWGGSATITGPMVLTGAGGVEWGGSATITGPYAPSFTGGVEWGGSATITGPFDVIGAGGVEWGGSATITGPFDLEGSGGTDWGGAASISAVYSLTGSGGTDWGGSATITYTPGGISFAGCSGVPATLYLHYTAGGGCSAFNAQTVTLNWNSGASRYEGTIVVGATTMHVRADNVAGSTVRLFLACTTFGAQTAMGTAVCSPFSVSFGSFLPPAACCLGTITATLNTTP